jgi:hypothetical protein
MILLRILIDEGFDRFVKVRDFARLGAAVDWITIRVLGDDLAILDLEFWPKRA